MAIFLARRLKYVGSVASTLLLLLLVTTGTVSAAGTPVTVTLALVGGVLTEVPQPVVVGSNLTIGGNVTYSIPIIVTDTTGSNAGWNLTIASTQFVSAIGGNPTLPANASTINTVPTVSVCAPLVCVTPNNTVSYASPLQIPPGTTTTAGSAVKFFNATANTGEGVMTVTPTVTVAVPPTTVVATYTATVTLNIISGP